MECLLESPEHLSDPEEAEAEVKLPNNEQEEREEGRGKNESPPYMKRQRLETLGEGWEAVKRKPAVPGKEDNLLIEP